MKNDHRESTIKDVAKLAGVSIATVSRVMHGTPVGKSTRSKVNAAIEELGYSPNMAARALRTNSTRTIACVIKGMLTPAMYPALRAIEESVRHAGYTLLWSGTESEVDAQLDTLQGLAAKGLDGLIFSGASDHDNEIGKALAGLNIPIVHLDRDPSPYADAVNVSHCDATRQSVHYLSTLGHRDIALLTIPSSILPGRERRRGYTEGMQECGLSVDEAWIVDTCTDAGASFRGASTLLSGTRRPSAVIAGGLSLCAPVLSAAQMHHLQLGRDLSLVAGCDTELTALFQPGITAIQWDIADWGRMAAEMLLERIRDPGCPTGRRV
ncbi:MAG TPA: LacI family DNA-binding transcriptional regulator, partial [Acidovorax sp.]|nr:LacI family DNA-binding transcriptional regulator [Acidovorax sp.]